MARCMQVAAAIAILFQQATPTNANNADVFADVSEHFQGAPTSVAVDLPLPSVPGQVHNGMYKQISKFLYIRDLPWVNIYFSLLYLPPPSVSSESVVSWEFHGYNCSRHVDSESRVCSEFVAATLESDRDQKLLHHSQTPDVSQTPHVISRQSPLTDEERRLQFEDPVAVDPPTFTTETAYYSCAYSGGGSSWCCAQSNQGSSGPYCWSLSTCTEEYSAWNQQNIICCTANAGDCVLTYQPVMPTTTPATTAPTTTTTTSAPTTTPVTSPPVTEDPFGSIPILVDTTAPSPETPAPTVSATAQTPTTASPTTPVATTQTPAPTVFATSAPAADTQTPTTDPFNDIPILADTTAPATQTPTATQPPVTTPTPTPTSAVTTQPSVTTPTVTSTPSETTPARTSTAPAVPTASSSPSEVTPTPTSASTTAPAATSPLSVTTPTTTTPAATSPPSVTTPSTITTAPATSTPSVTTPTATSTVTTAPTGPTMQPSSTSTTNPTTATPTEINQPTSTTTSTPTATNSPSDVPVLADIPVSTTAATPTTQPSTTGSTATQPPNPVTTASTATTASATPATGTPTTSSVTGSPVATSPPSPTGTASPVITTTTPSITIQPSTTPATGPSTTTTQPSTATPSAPVTDVPVLADTPNSITPTPTSVASGTPASTSVAATGSPSTLTQAPASSPQTPSATSETPTAATPSTPGSIPQTPTTSPASTTGIATQVPATSSSATPSVPGATTPTATSNPSTTPFGVSPTSAPLETAPVLAGMPVPTSTSPTAVTQAPALTPTPSTARTPGTPIPSGLPSTSSASSPSTSEGSFSSSRDPQTNIPSSESRSPVSTNTPTTASSPIGSTSGSRSAASSTSSSPPSVSSSERSRSSQISSSSVISTTAPSIDSSTTGTTAPGDDMISSRSTSSSTSLGDSDVMATLKPFSTATKDSSSSNTADEGSQSLESLTSARPMVVTRGTGGGDSKSSSHLSPEDILPRSPLASIHSTISDQSSSSNHATTVEDPSTISNAKDENDARSGDDDDEAFHRALIDFTHSFGPARDIASNSANILVATAVTSNVVSAAISIATTSTSAVSTAASGAAASNGLLDVVGGAAAGLRQAVPVVDMTGLFMMLNYLQFISSSSHLSLPTAPDFFFHFTDSLGWCNFQPTGVNQPSERDGHPDDSKEKLSSVDASNFTVADGDIISGVLAYAERINVKPEELFTKTAIVFVSVVGGVAAAVATLYSLLRLLLRRKLELLIQRLDDLPRAKLLMRLLIQSCLSICLLSEYALSMTSSFQMRYNEQQHHGSQSAFAFATVALIVVCCGLIVLGVVKIWDKSEEELSNPDFKFAWGAYYKYYNFESRYFFVAKMGAEILSGVIIGLVSDVPSQLTLLMSLQLAMFLFTVESAPYSMEFQTVCSSIAFVMKMVTYALISSFLTPSTDVSLQDFVGTLVIILQVTLLILFNSRQLYILYKQMKYLWELRQDRLRRRKQITNGVRNSVYVLTPTPMSSEVEETLERKRTSMVSTPSQFPVAAC